MVVEDSKKAFLELGFVGMVATHVYDHEWVGRSFIKHKKISKLWKFLKKHLLFFFNLTMYISCVHEEFWNVWYI